MRSEWSSSSPPEKTCDLDLVDAVVDESDRLLVAVDHQVGGPVQHPRRAGSSARGPPRRVPPAPGAARRCRRGGRSRRACGPRKTAISLMFHDLLVVDVGDRLEDHEHDVVVDLQLGTLVGLDRVLDGQGRQVEVPRIAATSSAVGCCSPIQTKPSVRGAAWAASATDTLPGRRRPTRTPRSRRRRSSSVRNPRSAPARRGRDRRGAGGGSWPSCPLASATAAPRSRPIGSSTPRAVPTRHRSRLCELVDTSTSAFRATSRRSAERRSDCAACDARRLTPHCRLRLGRPQCQHAEQTSHFGCDR